MSIHFFETKFLPNPKNSPPVKQSFEPAINKMLASVHQGVKFTPKPSAPKIPKAVADTITDRDPKVFLTGMGHKEKKRALERRSFPELKADLQMHNLRAARRGNDTSEISLKSQQRFREVLRQKRILENMLKEHQKLKLDRDSLASEINYMRQYLDNIRVKLDVSLRKLNSQKMSSLDSSKKAPKRTNGNQRPSRTNTSNTTRGRSHNVGQRMSGGVEKSRSPSASNKSLSAKKSMTRKPSKRWEYCPRIERKADVKFLASN